MLSCRDLLGLIICCIWLAGFDAFAAEAQPKCALQIEVVPGGWGEGAPLENIQKVLQSAAAQLQPLFPQRSFPSIRVSHTADTSPIAIYEPGMHGEREVRLTASSTYWAQYAYQFAHEFCHICCHYERVRADRNPNQWFEEALCEAASIFVVKRMAAEWGTAPPYPNWKAFAPALESYAANLEQAADRKLPPGTSLALWYREHESGLRQNPTQRQLNGVVANRILPLLQKKTEHWEALNWLNGDNASTDLSFPAFLARWHERVPQSHKAWVRQIASLFEVELP